MALTGEDFISHFHSLSGITIGEKRKQLFLLLNQAKTDGLDSNFDISCIKPKTPLEEKFKVEILIYFKNFYKLIELVKCENPILIERLFKINKWFVKELLKNVTSEQLVLEVFPNISFKLKVKFLNKIGLNLKNTKQAEDIFKTVEQNYGLHLAMKLLPSCSSIFILNFAKLNRYIPTPRELSVIAAKYPEIVEEIFNILNSREIDIIKQYKKVFNFIAKHNTLVFLNLNKKYNLSVNVGRKFTDKFIKIYKENVIKEPEVYYIFLHNKQLAKSLGFDFKQLYVNLFPKTIDKFDKSHKNIFRILKQLPNKMRDSKLLLATFERLYGDQIWNYPSYITPELLEILTPDERQDKLKLEYKPSHMSEDRWNCYYKTERSIPLLKQKISLSSEIKARVELTELLAVTCHLNKDKVALLDVCKYMVNRHRNDHYSVRLSFLRALRRNKMLEILEQQHWTCINELIKLFTLNNETFYNAGDFLQAYIHYRLLNKLSVREQLVEFVKLQESNFNILTKNPEYEKYCLLQFAEILPEVFDQTEIQKFNVSFLNALVSWNRRHPASVISLFDYPNAIDSLKETLNTQGYWYGIFPIVAYCLKESSNNKQRQEILKLYLISKNTYDLRIINNLIHFEPIFIQQNINDVTKVVLMDNGVEQNISFWNYCRYYSHLQIPLKIIEICLNVLQENNDKEDRGILIKNSVIALSYLMQADEYVNFIQSYYPSSASIKVTNGDKNEKFKILRSIGLSVKNIVPSSNAIETILYFAKGDYLRLIQRSLYSISDNLNETKIPYLLKEFSQRSVSVRKHALHISFRVLNKSHIYNVLEQFMETEKNANIQKFIFKNCFNFFVKNPDDRSWQLIEVNLNNLNLNDEVIEILMQIDKIPQNYFAKYVGFTWDMLNKVTDFDKGNLCNKTVLLNSISLDVIGLLPTRFCEDLIKQFLFKKSAANFEAAVQSFACKYILYSSSQIQQEETKLSLIFEALKCYLNSNIKHIACNTATNFLKMFCSEFLSEKCVNQSIFYKFMHAWNELLKPYDAFDAHLHLQLTLIYTEKLSLPEIANRIGMLCDSSVSLYGFIVLTALYNSVTYFLKYFTKDAEEDCYVLFENICKLQSSLANSLLTILLLNDHYPTLSETRLKYFAILKTLQQHPDPVIQIYLHNHLRDAEK